MSPCDSAVSVRKDTTALLVRNASDFRMILSYAISRVDRRVYSLVAQFSTKIWDDTDRNTD